MKIILFQKFPYTGKCIMQVIGYGIAVSPTLNQFVICKGRSSKYEYIYSVFFIDMAII